MPRRLTISCCTLILLSLLTIASRLAVVGLGSQGVRSGLDAIALAEGVLAGVLLLVASGVQLSARSRAANRALQVAVAIALFDSLAWAVFASYVLVTEEPAGQGALYGMVVLFASGRLFWVAIKSSILVASILVLRSEPVRRWLDAGVAGEARVAVD